MKQTLPQPSEGTSHAHTLILDLSLQSCESATVYGLSLVTQLKAPLQQPQETDTGTDPKNCLAGFQNTCESINSVTGCTTWQG